MRIFVWHGYLLGGTGSNIYARQLTREWSREGHDVTVFSQEPEPERFDLGGAATVRPDVGGLLPVFVLDRYEGYDVRRVQDCSRAATRRVGRGQCRARSAPQGTADFVFVNHVLLGGPVGAACGARYVVKAHGSELEYSMRGNAALSAWGGEVLERRGRDDRRLRPHPRRRARRLRDGRARARDPARRRRRAVAPGSRATRRSTG